MTNTLITPTVIANEMMLQLENNLVAAKLVNRDYEDEFVKVGDTIQIRRPVKFTKRSGPVMTPQDVEEGSISMQVAFQEGVDFSFSSKDKTLTVEKFSERYIAPAAITLANSVDQAVWGLFKNVGNWVGTPGNTFSGFASAARAGQRLDENAVPQDSRSLLMSPADNWGLIGAVTGLYTSDNAKTAFERAKLPPIGGMQPYASQNAPIFTTGTRGGTPAVNGANQNVTYANAKSTWTQTLNINGASNSITGWAKAGDVFTIAGVFDVNPATRAAQTRLKQFTVIADADSNGTGQVALTISPPIITSGPQQNCSAAPANSAALTFMGTASTAYPLSLAFHKNAFALAVRPLDIPDGAPPGARRVSGDGISIRMIPVYDGTNDVSNYRFDILFGVKAVFPELATRVSG